MKLSTHSTHVNNNVIEKKKGLGGKKRKKLLKFLVNCECGAMWHEFFAR
jgi:hypothetical protein